jgi:hypothetical protein
MIGVVGIDQGRASRRGARTARRSGRFSRSGASDGAETLIVTRARFGGHDGGWPGGLA